VEKAGADLAVALQGIGDISQESVAIARLQRGSGSHDGVEFLIREREWRHDH
jgi:hypothetical protein